MILSLGPHFSGQNQIQVSSDWRCFWMLGVVVVVVVVRVCSLVSPSF